MFTTQLHKPAAAEFLPGKERKKTAKEKRNSGTKLGYFIFFGNFSMLEWDGTIQM
jgi:hypothetical protein